MAKKQTPKAKHQQRKAAKKQKRTNQTGNQWWKDKTVIIPLLLIALVTFAVYIPALNNGLTNWDDDEYVTNNPYIRSLSMESIQMMFNTSVSVVSNYHPVTLLSLAFDYQLAASKTGEINPFPFHLTSVLLHVFNTIFVFLFVRMFTKGRIEIAAIVALLFGIHPMHVESVAWVAERKDVLYTFFMIPAFMTYLKYIEDGLSSGQKANWYALTFGLFTLSVLSKPAAVVFPVLLLLIDYFKNRPLRVKMLVEKIPFFILALIMGLMTVSVQSGEDAVGDFAYYTLAQRFMLASYGFITYLAKLVVPVHLCSFYPYPKMENGMPIIFMLAPFIVAALLGLAAWSHKRTKVGVFGLLFYAVSIALVLQFITVGDSLMNERYTYVPYIGIFMILGYGFSYVYRQTGASWANLKKGLIGLLAVYSLAMATLTVMRIPVWKSTFSLWTDVIEKFPERVPVAYNNRGNHYRTIKAYDKALADYDIAIKIRPKYDLAYNNKGNIYFSQQQDEQAIENYNKALEINPENIKTYVNRGASYTRLGKFGKAKQDFDKAIALDPNYPNTYLNRSVMQTTLDDYEGALQSYNAYLKLVPNSVDMLNARAVAYQHLQRFPESIKDFDLAIRYKPNMGMLYMNRSYSYNALGRKGKALQDAQKAQQLGAKVNPEYLEKLR